MLLQFLCDQMLTILKSSNRCGLIMETSSFCPYAIFKTTKQMSSSNTPPMRRETVRLYLSNLNDFSAANLPDPLQSKRMESFQKMPRSTRRTPSAKRSMNATSSSRTGTGMSTSTISDWIPSRHFYDIHIMVYFIESYTPRFFTPFV